jgi:hypothetical protein
MESLCAVLYNSGFLLARDGPVGLGQLCPFPPVAVVALLTLFRHLCSEIILRHSIPI